MVSIRQHPEIERMNQEIAEGPRKLRVLVVEDDLDSSESLATMLRLYEHEVEIALDGPSALTKAAHTHPDVVLLDIGLPGGMTGFEVAQELLGQKAIKQPLIVAITGHGQEEDRRQSEKVGIHLHLLKPVDPDKLLQMLERFRSIIF